jgi:hypothetical protein
MEQSLRTSILVFILIHFFAGLSWAKPFPEIKDGTLSYTDRFGTRASIPLEDIQRLYHEVDQIPVPDNASSELKEEIRLRNLENAWVHGRHYFRVGRETIHISLAQSIEIVRAQQMKDQPKHPNTYLTEEERQHLRNRLQEVQDSVSLKRAEMDSQIPKAERKVTTTEVDKLVSEALSKGTSIHTLVLDGIPYFLTSLENSPNVFTYNLGTKTAEVRSREVLACNLPTSPPSTTTNKLKLVGDTHTFYSTLSGNIALRLDTRIITMNTATGNSFCTTGPSERIFSNGFESGGVQ